MKGETGLSISLCEVTSERLRASAASADNFVILSVCRRGGVTRLSRMPALVEDAARNGTGTKKAWPNDQVASSADTRAVAPNPVGPQL